MLKVTWRRKSAKHANKVHGRGGFARKERARSSSREAIFVPGEEDVNSAPRPLNIQERPNLNSTGIFSAPEPNGPACRARLSRRVGTLAQLHAARAASNIDIDIDMGLAQLPDELLLTLNEQWPCRDVQLRQLAALTSVP